MRSGAPYVLLQQCQQQCARYQQYYNTASGSSSSSSSSGGWQHGLAELLAGFFVRFSEVMVQWLENGRHRCGMRMPHSFWASGWVL
jgi:hypothetical protein